MRIVRRATAPLLAGLLVVGLLLVASPAEAAARPSAPRAAAATALDHAVRVTWRPPRSTGGSAIDRYAVQRWNPATLSWRNVRSLGRRARAWTATGLTNGTTYYFRVLAHNRVGWSPASRQVKAVPRGVPGGVPYVEADTADSELRLKWGTAAPNGRAVDHYAAEISTNGVTWARTTKVTGLSAVFTGLKPGTRYWFRVRAHNIVGYGLPGGAGPYRAYTAPGLVRNLALTTGDGSVDLTWDPPVSDVSQGLPAASLYLVEQSSDGGATWVPAGESETGETAATSATITGLTNGEAYVFRVSARPSINAIGYGTPVEVPTDLVVGAPGRPRDPVTAWNDASGQFELTWTAPLSNGAAVLDHYEVTTDPDGATTSVPAVDTTAAPVDGLVGQLVRACNAFGCSGWATAPALPGQPTDLVAGSPDLAGIQWRVPLTWAAPTDGAEVASYHVERSEDAGASWAPLAEITDLSDLSYVDTTADPTTTYHYRVIAVGPTGAGQPTAAATATTGVAQALSANPTSLSMIEGDATTLEITLAHVSATDVVVLLSSDDPAVATTSVASVVIPAGQLTASVTVEAVVDDNIVEDITSIVARIDDTTSVAVPVTVAEPT